MSRVDKKPTYKGHTAASLAKWSRAVDDPELLSAMCSIDEIEVYYAISDGRAIAWTDTEIEDMRPGADTYAIYVSERAARTNTTGRHDIARGFLRTIFDGKRKVLWDAPAAVKVARIMLEFGKYAIDISNSTKVVKAAYDAFALVSEDAFCTAAFASAVGTTMEKDQKSLILLATISAARKCFTSSASRASYEEWACISAFGRFHDAYIKLLDMDAADRFSIPDHLLATFFDKVHYAAGVLFLIKGGEVYILGKEGRNKARQMLNSAFQAELYARLNRLSSMVYVDADRLCIQIRDLFEAACKQIDAGLSHATVVKSLQKWHIAMFQAMPEFYDQAGEIGEEHSVTLFSEAVELWPGVRKWMEKWGNIPDHLSMEMCKLGTIFTSDEADAAECVERLKKAQDEPRAVEKNTWADFMDFVKAYDFVQELRRTKIVPAYGGVLVKGDWLRKSREGSFVMPPREHWGKFWIENHYDDKNNLRYEWLDAQDVTWIGPYHERVMEIGNELAESWVHGPLIDRVREAEEAANFTLVHGMLLYWATKAEGSKTPGKMRLTASSCAGSRALFSNFETAERAHADTTPGFGQNMSPFDLCDKMSKIAARSDNAPRPIASSHDVKGWSEFEDRRAKDEYLAYECGKFKDHMVKEAHKLWHKVHSVFDRLGHKYKGDFVEGGVQGLNGGADTLMHAKIIAYVHQRGIEKALFSGGANALTCIDDVTYNPDTTILDLKRRVANVRTHISDIYEKLAYPLDPTKSVFGILKYVYLNDAYCDKALIASPIRVALKMDVDETPLIRDIITDVSGYMSTASSASVAQAPPFVAYAHGLLNVFNYLNSFYSAYIPVHICHQSVWAFAPPGEGGLGLPTYREFLAGADADKGFTWRDSISRSEHCNTFHATCLAAMSGHGLVPVPAEVTIRDPYAIIHSHPKRGDEVKRTLVEEAMKNIPHAKQWDELRDRGYTAVKELANFLTMDMAVVDAPIIGDIISTFPDSLYQGAVSRFASGSALQHLTSSRNIWKIARAVARADRKWMQYMRNVATLDGYGGVETPVELCRELRSICHPDVSCINNVIPSPRAFVAYAGTIGGGEVTHMDWVRVASNKKRTPGNRNSVSQWGSVGGRSVGTKSATITFTDMGKAMRKSVVGAKLAKMGVLLGLMREMEMHTDGIANAFESAWGIKYSITSILLTDSNASVKRVSSIIGRSHCLALGFRNIYTTSSAKYDIMLDFVNTNFNHSLCNPVLIGHTLRLCALSCSVLAGAHMNTMSDINWGYRPAADVPWAYDTHPSTFCLDVCRAYPTVVHDVELFDIPTSEDIIQLGNTVGLLPGPAPQAVSYKPKVEPVAIYRIEIERPDIGNTRPSRKIVPVRRAIPPGTHARNMIASSIVRTRLAEHLRATKTNVEDIIWGEEDADHYIPVSVIDSCLYDIKAVLDLGVEVLCGVLNYMTQSSRFSGCNIAQIHQIVTSDTYVVKALVKHAYDGVVGKGEHAYSTAQRALVMVSNPAEYDANQRLRILKERNAILQRLYTKRIAASKTPRDSSFNQGRCAARTVVVQKHGGIVEIDRVKIIGYFSQTSGFDSNLIAAEIPVDASYASHHVKTANSRIASRFTSLKWDVGSFNRGFDIEYNYIISDAADMEKKIYSMSRNDMDSTREQKTSYWSVSSAPIPTELAPATEDLFAAFSAAATAAASTNTILDALVNYVDSDDEGEAYAGII